MSVNIKYKNNSIAELSDTGTKTLKTAGKYCEADIIVENTKDGITPSGNKAITATTSTQTGIDVTNYATVSVAPTPSETKSVTTNGDVTPSSGKLLSKVTVNVPTGTARDSSDLTVSGATVNVPAGLYSSAASKSVASGTAGTPTASKSAVSNNSVTVTPSVTNTEGYITGGTKTGTGVKVSASELVSGNKAITPSETAQSGIDVTNFKTASVGAISSTYVGSGVTRKAAATVAPSTSEQTVCASGVYTTGAQKVSAITPSIVGNLDASSFAASIVAAVEGKGVTVPDGTLLDGMAALIESIEAGSGGGGAGAGNIATGSFTNNELYDLIGLNIMTIDEWVTNYGAFPTTLYAAWFDENPGAITSGYYPLYCASCVVNGNAQTSYATVYQSNKISYAKKTDLIVQANKNTHKIQLLSLPSTYSFMPGHTYRWVITW